MAEFPAVSLIEELPSLASPAQAVSLLINAAVGAGVLSLPFAFKCAGWAGGLCILAVVGAVESLTLYVLSRWAEATGAGSYGELVRKSLGPAASTFLNLSVFLYTFGSAVAYLIIIGDCFSPLVHTLGLPGWWGSREAVIVGISSTMVLPLCFGRTLGAAAGISAVNFVAFVAVITALVAKSGAMILHSAHPFQGSSAFSSSFMTAIPIAVFGLQCHAQVVAVFNELTAEMVPQWLGLQALRQAAGAKTRRPRSPKLLGMTQVIIVAIATTALGYAAVGLSVYLAFPTSVQSNVLNTFPATDKLVQVVRGVVGVLEIASYPVNHLPARQAIRDVVAATTGIQLGGNYFIAAETLLFYLGSLAIALVVRDLGAVFALVGGTCGSCIIMGLPGALMMERAYSKHGTAASEADPLLQHSEAAGGGEEQPPSPSAFLVYSAMRSKLFWGGAALLAAAMALITYTCINILLLN